MFRLFTVPRINLARLRCVFLSLLFLSVLLDVARAQPATALIDGDASPLYKGLHGYLYGPITGAGSPTENTAHASWGQNVVIQPLCADGTTNCDPSLRKIVVLAVGFSNWTYEICHLQTSYVNGDYSKPCDTYTFIYKANQLQQQGLINSSVALIDCAVGGAPAADWVNDTSGPSYNPNLYTSCDSYLGSLTPALTPLQVQVIIYKDADSGQNGTLGTAIPNNFNIGECVPNPANYDVCDLMTYFGQTARYIQTRYPNVKQMFVHSRIYGGYANIINESLNPEPFAFEHGYIMKWIVQSQISEVNLGTGYFAPVGSLRYTTPGTVVAPWIDWGAYLWADGSTQDCINCPIDDGTQSKSVWLQADAVNPAPPNCPSASECDFLPDYTHPSACGRDKVSSELVYAYCNSPYTSRWFRTNPSVNCAATIPAVSPVNCPPPN